MTFTVVFSVVLIAQLFSTTAMASCYFPPGEVVRCDPDPAERAVRSYVAEYLAASASPVLYVVTYCNVTEPINVEPLHPQYREWLANRCYDDESAAAQLRHSGKPKFSFYRTFEDVGVVRCNRTRVTNAAQLEAVSSRITGDGRQNGQEGVLIVDLGLREDEEGGDEGDDSAAAKYRPDRLELFVHHGDGTLAAN